jgi:hypothetical protein
MLSGKVLMVAAVLFLRIHNHSIASVPALLIYTSKSLFLEMVPYMPCLPRVPGAINMYILRRTPQIVAKSPFKANSTS